MVGGGAHASHSGEDQLFYTIALLQLGMEEQRILCVWFQFPDAVRSLC